MINIRRSEFARGSVKYLELANIIPIQCSYREEYHECTSEILVTERTTATNGGFSLHGHLFVLQKSHRSVARIRPGWWPVNRGWLWIEWLPDSWRRLTTSRSSTETRPALFAIQMFPLMIIAITIPCRSIRRIRNSSSRRQRGIGKSIYSISIQNLGEHETMTVIQNSSVGRN